MIYLCSRQVLVSWLVCDHLLLREFGPYGIIFKNVCFVNIVSGYGLDYRAIEVQSPGEATGFLLQPVCSDRLWGPPSLLYNRYRGPFPGAKARPGRDADHSSLSSAKVENE
jgi:hypothetical protein